ncbi:MAG: hypothetical protein LQ352_001422 [Teloschistes flavicans]|nr:MAG: hypothetical protein LQ352_001422 [Teloschistes flavicans]
MAAASGPNPAKIKTRPGPASHIRNGEYSTATRALALGSYFVINASQFLGAPLYLINEDWYNAWIAFTKQSWGLLTTSMTQCWAPTVVRVSGHKSVRGELLKTTDGNLLSNFPERLILIANHQVSLAGPDRSEITVDVADKVQIYTDWLYLWWFGYTNGMHGRIYVVLKESLRRIPVIGWGMQFSQFIFLKRNWEKDKDRLAAHLQKLNGAVAPMWLMLFPEGTNLHPVTRKSSKKWADKNGIPDMQHQLLPRSKGLQFCIQNLRKTVPYVYDCTIAYEGVPTGQYASEIFTIQAAYFGGKPPKSVNMYWRRFDIWSIPVDNDKAFDSWLRARWIEKDQLLDHYQKTGRFPADTGVSKLPSGKKQRGAGYIETEIKPNKWYEYLQIFAPVGLLALVLYMFYGGLPKRFTKDLGKQITEQSRIEGPQNLEELVNSTPRIVEVDSTNASTAGSDPLAVRTQTPTAAKKAIKKLPPKRTTAQKAPSTAQPKAVQAVRAGPDPAAVRKSKTLGSKPTAGSKLPNVDVKPATGAASKPSETSNIDLKRTAGEAPKKIGSKDPNSSKIKSGVKPIPKPSSNLQKGSPQKPGTVVDKPAAPKLSVKSSHNPTTKAAQKEPKASSVVDKESHPLPKKLEIKSKTGGNKTLAK